ncbi:MAG: S8 family serine peptidase [Bacteroidota bacterium]|nr:S8 family serine peptidase [Bacteroidota bacterium]
MNSLQSFAPVALLLIPILLFRTDRSPTQDTSEVVPHVVVVQFEAEIFLPGKTATTGLQIFDQKAVAYGVHTIERMYPFLDHVDPTPKTRRNLLALRRTYFVRYSADVTPERLSRDLTLAPGVVYAEPVPVNRTQGPVHWKRIDPNDPRFRDQRELGLMRLPEAWDVVKSSDGVPRVVIAIVDEGGEWRHEELHANVWTNEDEILGNGIDDDNNGFIDDVHGVNFSNGDAADNDPTPSPGNSHGTWVAGLASAVTDNNVGIAGAAWNAEIMHINAACPGLDGVLCKAYEGILYAAMNGADIVNASWGGLVRNDLRARHIEQTLDLATDMGALVVAAAGNSSISNDLFRVYPARFPRVLSVGATEKDTRRRAELSNYGRLVNVFAPGTDILTIGPGNSYYTGDGTSLSSPLTAGVASLVKTRFPAMDPDALREHIRLTSENIDLENPGFASQLGRGLVNALAAVQEPTLPAVRLKRWSWADQDDDRRIAAGEVVTITATVVNYLSDAQGLSVGLVAAEPYPFLDMTEAEVEVGFLAGGDSVEVQIEFMVVADVPDNQRVHLYTRIQDGAFEDGADQLLFNSRSSPVTRHQSLSAFYTAMDGDNWDRNDNWDITRVPSEEELARWFGVSVNEGFLDGLEMEANNLNGTLPPELENLRNLRVLALIDNEGLAGPIPPELGNLEQLEALVLSGNSITGEIPPELGNLEQLEALLLSGNSLTGEIPPELGNLEQLEALLLSGNSLTGEIPPELGNLEQLVVLRIHRNSFTGQLPRTLMQLGNLQIFTFEGQSLCAPADDAFQMWLNRIFFQSGPTCVDEGLADIQYDQGQAVGAGDGNHLFVGLEADARMATRFVVNASSGGKLWNGIVSGNDREARIKELLGNQRGRTDPATGPEERTMFFKSIDKDNWEKRIRVLLRDVWEGRVEVSSGNEQERADQRVSIGDREVRAPTPAGGKRDGRFRSSSGQDPEGRFGTPSADDREVRINRIWLAPYYANQFFGTTLPTDAPRNLTIYIYSDQEGTPADVLFSKEVEDPRAYAAANYTLDFFELDLSNEGIGALPDTIHIAYGNAGTDDNLLVSGPAPYTEENVSHVYLQGAWQPLWDLTTTNGGSFNETVVPIRASFRIQTPLHFAQMVAAQLFILGQSVTPLVLPEAVGGVSPISYSLVPALPTGLTFDTVTRTISGTPTEITMSPVTLTYTATDAAGDMVSMMFNVEVHSSVASEAETVPSAFALHGNYPNPFAGATRILFDLPAAARVSLDVLDITGRRVRRVPARMLEAGWDRSIDVSGAGLPSGMFMYRMRVDLPEGATFKSGSFIHIR